MARLYASSRLLISPEPHAKCNVDNTRNANITFCKSFWGLCECKPMQQVPKWFCPQLAVNDMISIPAASSQFLRSKAPRTDGQVVEIPAPTAHTGLRPITARVLSTQKLNAADRSPSLLFHCHGGGFVATTSKSHETYLRVWAKLLGCPILSVDYSLAPENPFPRAIEEVLYAYAWALNNPEKLGWTGERICLTGDSAGGNLMMATTLRLVELGVERMPDGLVLSYTPFMFHYLPSPSRMLSMMDPLLPMGIVLRCLAAYTNNMHLFQEPPKKFNEECSCEAGQLKAHQSLQEYVEELRKSRVKERNGTNLPGPADFFPARNGTDGPASDQIVSLINLQNGNGTHGQGINGEKAAQDMEEEYVTPSEEWPPNGILGQARSPHINANRHQRSKVTFSLNADYSTTDDEIDDEIPHAYSHKFIPSKTSDIPEKSFLKPCASESVIKTKLSPTLSNSSAEEATQLEIDEMTGTTVEIRRDPTRIWLTASICDNELVEYLRRHELTKRSLVILNTGSSSGSSTDSTMETNAAPPPESTVKRPLVPSPSIGTIQEASETNGPFAAMETTPRRSLSKIGRSFSTTFGDTVAMATGHAYDHLSGWFERDLQAPAEPADRKRCRSAAYSDGDEVCEESADEMSEFFNCDQPAGPLRYLRNFELPKNKLISPMFAEDELLAQLPPIHLVSGHLDPLLDDSVTFARRVRGAGGAVTLDLLDGLPHGFLNFTLVSRECRQAAKVCLNRIRNVLRRV